MPTSDAVRGLVQRLLDLGDFTGREQLLAQVAGVEYIEGPVTMMDLRVVGQCASAIGVPSPVPSTPTVVDERGEAIGELLLWLDAQGYINGPSPRIVDTVVVDYAAVGSVVARWAS